MTFEEWYESEKSKGLDGLDIDAMGIGAYDAAKAAWDAAIESEKEARRQRGREILERAHERFMGESIVQKGRRGDDF